MSGCTNTVSNSVRISAPVGHASMQPAFVQCLQTSDMNSHDVSDASSTRSMSAGLDVSTKRTCRQVDADSRPVLSYERPASIEPPSATRSFHCLHATSHALQPMHVVVSVKKPMRSASRRTDRSELGALTP